MCDGQSRKVLTPQVKTYSLAADKHEMQTGAWVQTLSRELPQTITDNKRIIITRVRMIPLISNTDMSVFLQSPCSHIMALTRSFEG